jgi:hypothetical protein
VSETKPTPEDVEKLTRALEAERAEHKATKEAARGFRSRIASGFGLGDDANDDAISARLADTEAALAARTAALTKERDEARARAADIESRWASEKVDSALRAAFEKSGAKPEHLEDFLILARPLFGVDEKGNVRTKPDAPDTLPNADPAAWIHSELKARRSHYWSLSVSGGAKGISGIGHVGGPSIDCFKPGKHNLTEQFALVSAHGASAVRSALQRAGLQVPGWMK